MDSALRSSSGRYLAATLASGALLLALVRQQLRLPRHVRYAEGKLVLGRLLPTLRSLFHCKLYDDLTALHEKVGQTFAYHLLGIPFVATIDPKNVEHVLKTNFDNYVKGSLFRDPFTQLLGDGIFNVDGAIWYQQRKTASRMFTKTQFETHIIGVILRNTRRVADILHQSNGVEVDMFNLFNRFTLDTIGEIGFSRDIGSLEDPSSPFLKSFDFAQSAMIKRFWTGHGIPIWKILRCFRLSWERELPTHFEILNTYTESVVLDLIQKVDAGEDNSFVGLFMKDAASQKLRETDPQGFKRFMRDMVLNFLLAGRDTTAQGLTWTMFELVQHLDVLEKARTEVQAVCGSLDVTCQHVKDLPYVRAILDENQRLHPSVPIDGKMAVSNDVLPDGAVVPAGCFVQVSAWAQGRSVEIWGQDAGIFRPERWLERGSKPSAFEFIAFNAGPRECLGKRLAELEMAVLVATLIRDFDFSLAVEPTSISYDTQLTLGCNPGLPMRVHARMNS